MEEKWKTIKDFPEYEISNYGRVKSNKFNKQKIIKQSKSKGYFKVCLSVDGINYHRRIHRLVLENFIGECLDNMEGSHLDGNKENNNLQNLVWESTTENNRRCSHVKLNLLKVSWIRLLLKNDFSPKFIANGMGISETHIYNIKNNKRWICERMVTG